MSAPEAATEGRPALGALSGIGRLTAVPIWARLALLTAAGLISLIGSTLFLSSALDRTADRTIKMEGLMDVAGAAAEAHVTFGELRYWLTDLSVSLLVTSERHANEARQRLDAELDQIAAHEPDTIATIRSEVDAYLATAMDAADAYTDGNRVIGNTLLAQARAHSSQVDDALKGLVETFHAAAFAERQIVVERAAASARIALYLVVGLTLIGLGLTGMVFRSIVRPLQRLTEAVAGITQGRYDVEIPSEGGRELGEMARALRMFRENAIERARLEAEAEKQHNMVATAIETVSDGFVLYDRDACVLLANSKYSEMFPEVAPLVRPGVSLRDILSAQVDAGRIELDGLAPEQWIAERIARHQGTPNSADERAYGDIWVRITKRQTPDGGKVAVYTDITALKRREAEITKARDAAEAALRDLRTAQARLIQAEKMASLGQLTAGIAHEIKNPLNFVNNFAKLSEEMLQELAEIIAEPVKALESDARNDVEDLLGTVRKNLAKINEHGMRADSIVKNMLLHSREGPSERQIARVNAIAEEALNLAYHGARAENPKFQVTLEKTLAEDAGSIDCFPQDLLRVFLNLISNGMYAAHKRADTEGDDFAPTITLTSRRAGDNVELIIRDNGTGIPPDIQEKIFMPFFTTKPAGEGTGLGLSLSYDIVVKQHGGELTVESEPDGFTAFRVSLPVGREE